MKLFIGEKIRKLRRDRNLTQEEVAAHLGISFQSISKWEKNRSAGRHEENVLLMREALKSFPNDSLLLVQLSASLHRRSDTAEEKERYIKEAVAAEEQILAYGADSEVRGAVMYNICFSYDKLGWREKAIEQARKLPNMYKARENALVYFLEGDEKREVSRAALEPLAWAVKKHLYALSETEGDEEWRRKADIIAEMLK